MCMFIATLAVLLCASSGRRVQTRLAQAVESSPAENAPEGHGVPNTPQEVHVSRSLQALARFILSRETVAAFDLPDSTLGAYRFGASPSSLRSPAPGRGIRMGTLDDLPHLKHWASSRRGLLNAAALASLGCALGPTSVSAAGGVDYIAVAASIADLVKADPDKGPTLVRLAWHSSGTYDKMANDGGSNGGTIRFKEELSHGANAGLDKAVKWLDPFKAKYPSITYADLYTLAGVAAIAAMGGPKIGWGSGRVDAMDASAVTADGRLPAADKGSPKDTAQGLRDTFYRMGFNDKEIVALSGAHALGRCHSDASGYDGPWTSTPTSFNNVYFLLLKNIKWTKRDWTGPLQYEDPSKKLMMLPSDLVLLQDEEFEKYVTLYAKDAKAFNADFAAAFQKLEQLGTKGLTPVVL